MGIRSLACLVVLIQLTGCSGGGGAGQYPAPPQPRDPDPAPPVEPSVTAAHEEAEIMTTINQWLRRFRDEQNQYHLKHLRYSEDVTVGGRLQTLPSPYRTRFEGHARGWNYWVEVRHPPTNQSCELRDGGMTPGEKYDDAGEIRCR